MATLLDSRSYLIPGKLKVTEFFFKVPLDYSNPSSGTLRIFARGLTRHEGSVAFFDENEKAVPRPWLAWLQGGPGKGCQPPQDTAFNRAFVDRGYQLLYMDQRGAGLSSPVTAETLALRGDAQAQADYIKLFRADNIVADSEAIRQVLTREYPPELKKWTIWGQSFGGYCALTYLSKHPQGLREVFISAGVPPISKGLEAVYERAFKNAQKRNRAYYEKFPEDVQAVHELAAYLASQKGGVKMPAGGLLTVQRFLTVGMLFGQSGGLDKVHDIVLRMRLDLEAFGLITRPTLSAIEAVGGYDDSVIYGVIREAIYNPRRASNWAAQRVAASTKEFSWVLGSSPEVDRESPLYFSAGMVFPFFFETFSGLQKLGDVAEIIAQFEDWQNLYDEEQLARNEVPVYAANYVDDAIIDFGLAQETIAKVKNCKQFISNELYHDGVRAKTAKVLEGLLALKDDVKD